MIAQRRLALYRNAVTYHSPGLALSSAKGLPWVTVPIKWITLKALHTRPHEGNACFFLSGGFQFTAHNRHWN